MRLLFIRHADPDYVLDSLTPTGIQEAEALRDYLSSYSLDEVYCSPLGRARKTMEIALSSPAHEGIVPIVLPYLKEFDATIPAQKRSHICWDFLPEELEEDEELLTHPQDWVKAKIYASSPDLLAKVKERFDGIDETLAKNGYIRVNNHYETKQGNERTIAFFCHFGVESLLLAHLINCSPVSLWHGTCAAPSSITEVYTEERREGKVSFRISHFGDTSHLKLKGYSDSFSARFSETFLDPRRHD